MKPNLIQAVMWEGEWFQKLYKAHCGWYIDTSVHTCTNTFGYETKAEIWWNTEKARNNNTRTFMFTIMIVMSNILSEPKKKEILDRRIKAWTKKTGRVKEKIEWKSTKKSEKDGAGRGRKRWKKQISSFGYTYTSQQPNPLLSIGHFFRYIAQHILCSCKQRDTKNIKNKTT